MVRALLFPLISNMQADQVLSPLPKLTEFNLKCLDSLILKLISMYLKTFRADKHGTDDLQNSNVKKHVRTY